MSLRGQVFIVTGANCGLGLETARGLIVMEATVVLACRSLDRARDAVHDLSKNLKGNDRGELVAMELDLGSLSSVRSFASSVLARFPRISCLVCNAGVMVPMNEFRRTRDGFELHVGVNHLGHFLLVNLLLDRLKESAPSRVVVVSSLLLKEGRLDLTNLNYESGIRQPSNPNSTTPVGYADSKLMNALFALHLSRILENSDVRVFCVSPGWCKTRLHQNSRVPWYLYPALCFAATFFMTSASKGCGTILHCATTNLDSSAGLFYRRKAVCAEMDEFLSEKSREAQDLWEESRRLVNLS